MGHPPPSTTTNGISLIRIRWGSMSLVGLNSAFFPCIVATVSFDHLVMDWIVKGLDVVTAALDLHDANAKDELILSELYTFAIIYRATIVRAR
jgi:hypothetical protein